MVEDNEKTLDDKEYQTPDINGESISNKDIENQKKEMQKTREKLESLKKFITSKFKSINAIGIIPPQAAEIFDEENELPEEERKKKPMHLLVVLPDKKEKEFNKIKIEIIKKIQETKQNVWLNLFLESDLWEICMDSKYEVIEAIGMSFPLYDKGILGALRVAQIHKSLVLKKFEKYIYSYVIGGSLIRGETIKTSDVDTYIIIDDTDVKRMPRLELKEKLRNIIYSYVMQAGELAGVQNKLSPQIYLLTEFWDGIKDANPIFYTFIRDGVPLYDRGGFLPWKLLLRMGKIRPSPESIDMYMNSGEKMQEIVKRKLLDIVMGDIYWGVITPTQAILMLYGLPPVNVYETVAEMKKIFVEKEKLLDKKYWEILNEIAIKYYKGYEHEKIKEVSGKEIDKLLKDSDEYLKKLKELRKDIEERMQEKTFKEIYNEVINLMKSLFGDKSEKILIKKYESEIINKGQGNPKFLHTLKNLFGMKEKYKNKKPPERLAFERLRKNCVYLIESLVEYGQRKELGILERTKVVITHSGKHSELFLTKPAFLVSENKIKKLVNGNIEDADPNEFNETLSNFNGKRVVMTQEIMKLLKKELGNFDIAL